METLSWHRHIELVGNQFIHLNLQPSLPSVYLETLYFLQYSSFIFSSVPCITCSKLKLGPHRHFHSSHSSYSHHTTHTCWVFSTYSHTEEMDFLLYTGMCFSSHCSWLDSMHSAVCSYPRAPFWQALSWHCNCITASLVFKLNQNFKVLIHCNVDQWEWSWNPRKDFIYTKIMFPVFNILVGFFFISAKCSVTWLVH